MAAITAGRREAESEETDRTHASCIAWNLHRCKPVRAPSFEGRMRAFPLLFLLLPAACAMGGALRQARIVGQCAEGDVACSRRHPQAPIAVGTRFYPEVSASIDGSSTPNLVLESAAPEILAVEGGALVGKRPGTSAVLITTDDASVVDFVHVWVAPVTQLTLMRRDGDRVDGAIGLAVGEDVTITPALWSGAQRLSGAGDVAWTVAPEGAVSVLRDGSPDRRRLRARAPGKATITAALGDTKASVDVEVVP